MDPFTLQDNPAEYTLVEWSCQDTSIVVLPSTGGHTVQVWVWTRGKEALPSVLPLEWRLEDQGAILEVARELATVLGPLVPLGARLAASSRAVQLLAMQKYGDVYNGSYVAMYSRSIPRRGNPWITEIAELEEEIRTGIRRHTFGLNPCAPPLLETLCGRFAE